jgi:hypothetical protein
MVSHGINSIQNSSPSLDSGAGLDFESRRSVLQPEFSKDEVTVSASHDREVFTSCESCRLVLTPHYIGSPVEWATLESSYPVASDSDSRRSFLRPQFVDPSEKSRFAAADESRTDDSMSARPFPQVEYTEDNNRHRASLHQPKTLDNPASSSPFFKFAEFNGMRTLSRVISDMDQYLEHRRGWQGMIIKNGVPKTMRFEAITKHMVNGSPDHEEYMLVKLPQIYFRTNTIGHKRTVGTENEEGNRAKRSDKRQKKT